MSDNGDQAPALRAKEAADGPSDGGCANVGRIEKHSPGAVAGGRRPRLHYIMNAGETRFTNGESVAVTITFDPTSIPRVASSALTRVLGIASQSGIKISIDAKTGAY